MRRTVCRRLSMREGRSRAASRRNSRRRSMPVFERYASPSAGQSAKTAGRLGNPASSASSAAKSDPVSTECVRLSIGM